MALNETLLQEFDQEMATTRQLLAGVPARDAAWKPHPKQKGTELLLPFRGMNTPWPEQLKRHGAGYAKASGCAWSATAMLCRALPSCVQPLVRL